MTHTTTSFYLFASASEERAKSTATVFYRVEGEPEAKALCNLFTREYSETRDSPAFYYESAIHIAIEQQILLDESLDWLMVYYEPDSEIYEPQPSRHTLFLAQCAIRAQKWEELLRRRSGPKSQTATSNPEEATHKRPSETGDLPRMSQEENRNAGLILLYMLAQTYYKMLESVISMASWYTATDLQLNESYFWTIKNLTNLLANHDELKDFPAAFEPLFPDLYPSTIGDCDWEDMIAPDAERFLSTVQQYVHSKGIYDPPEGSTGWAFIEMFRPGVNLSVERAIAYRKRMQNFARTLDSSRSTPSASASTSEIPEETKETKFGSQSIECAKVFISYSHKDKSHLDDLLTHLKPLSRGGSFTTWSDKQIPRGSQWFEEIRKALSAAKVAVLLVTKDFLASDFIHDHELGPFLKEAATGGVQIRWILVGDCNWKKTPLNKYQAAFPTDKALAAMSGPKRDSAWIQICDEIEAAANL